MGGRLIAELLQYQPFSLFSVFRIITIVGLKITIIRIITTVRLKITIIRIIIVTETQTRK